VDNVSIRAAEATLGRLFRFCYEETAKQVYSRMADAGFPEVRPAHSSLLRNISMEGSRVADLAAMAGITKQSMAYLSESLQAAGYATLVADPDDRRAKRVMLTERGKAALAALTRLSMEVEGALAAKMGAEKIAELRGLLMLAAETMDAQAD
jgi:DNA-binding MarR family transcriptional regulator